MACVDWRLFDDSVVNDVNLSDHCVVSLTVVPHSVDVNTAQDKVVHAPCVPKPSALWQQAFAEHIEQFKLFVSAKIVAIVCHVPAHLFACKGCSAQVHLDAFDSLALKLHAVLADSTVACVPHHNSNASVKPEVLIGWNNECAQLKADTLFWYRLWVSGGRPNVGVIHDIMRSTRKRYHFAVKVLLRSQTDLRNACLAEASINKPPNVFWREVKRANARPSSVQVSNVVNGQTDCHDIANEFKNTYSIIFRAGFTMVDNLDVLSKELNDSCINSIWEKFSVDELGTA